MLTPEEFKEKMESAFDDLDAEQAHMVADSVIVDLLRGLGYGDGAEVFDRSEKGYELQELHYD